MSRRTYLPMKRALDLLIAGLSVVILAPMLAVIAVLVRIRLGSPILFRQERPGQHARSFIILKFRTMRAELDTQGRSLADHERLTRFGRTLRRSSLDELPELFNVLVGDMSLVGPRPLLTQYVERYTPEQARRHEVKPGITGWAQVNGRNALTWEEKFALDVWYVDHRSIGLDVKILLKTVGEVVAGRGINAPGAATAVEFMGSTPKERSS
jgi:lipopolysaccharide/colanic/teichoic acid biosynthesis glycosyltransferase